MKLTTRKIQFAILPIILLISACAKEIKEDLNPVVTQSFSEDWKFKAGGGNDSLAVEDLDDSDWIEVKSTKTLKDQSIDLIDNHGWFRKTIVLSDSLKQSIDLKGAAVLRLGKFGWSDEVYVNGTLVGQTGTFPPDFIGFDYDRNYLVLRENLNPEGDNVIAIKFSQGWLSGGFLDTIPLVISSATTQEKITLDTKVGADNFIFSASDPTSEVKAIVDNKNKWAINVQIMQSLTTDDHRPIWSDSISTTIKGNTAYSKVANFPKLAPDFYRYAIEVKYKDETIESKKFNIGREPEKIVSPLDTLPDLKAFWDASLQELSKVAPNYRMKHLPDKSNESYDLYKVEMRSFENELISGYYAKPKKEGKFPVIVEYMGYGSFPYEPYMHWDGFAYFILSVRGQGLNNETNRFGKWITYGLQSKEAYYYRGAFMDVVRALDFVCSRPEIDADRIGTRGGSQGGAFTFVSVALDKRVKVAAPSIPFLSDYRDYFAIAPWPKSDFDEYLKENPTVTWDQVYSVLAYFDIKNLAPWIECPLLMGIGVQDEVCPPHINFAAYNLVKSEKQWLAFPYHSHSVGKDYYDAANKLFKEKLNPMP